MYARDDDEDDGGGFIDRLVDSGGSVVLDPDGEFRLRGGGENRAALERELFLFADSLKAVLGDGVTLF